MAQHYKWEFFTQIRANSQDGSVFYNLVPESRMVVEGVESEMPDPLLKAFVHYHYGTKGTELEASSTSQYPTHNNYVFQVTKFGTPIALVTARQYLGSVASGN